MCTEGRQVKLLGPALGTGRRGEIVSFKKRERMDSWETEGKKLVLATCKGLSHCSVKRTKMSIYTGRGGATSNEVGKIKKVTFHSLLKQRTLKIKEKTNEGTQAFPAVGTAVGDTR